ncbi:hypothetical protein EDD21DRAFT_402982 [Dissophora ornata]|nr:hypothetical protein EDD21DRAFT_402982 [Dissophora ornata]
MTGRWAVQNTPRAGRKPWCSTYVKKKTCYYANNSNFYPGYPGYPPYPGSPSYPSYPPYPDYPPYPGSPPYPGYLPYPGSPSYPSYPPYPDYPPYPRYPGYPSYPSYPTYPKAEGLYPYLPPEEEEGDRVEDNGQMRSIQLHTEDVAIRTAVKVTPW